MATRERKRDGALGVPTDDGMPASPHDETKRGDPPFESREEDAPTRRAPQEDAPAADRR